MIPAERLFTTKAPSVRPETGAAEISNSIAGEVERVISEMTLAEKIGQMTQVSNESITPDEAGELGIGSILSGGDGNPAPNTPEAWSLMVGDFMAASTESRLQIPLIYGVDAVHGHSNVGGATVFPHNIGLGGVGDPSLVQRIGVATSREMRATGVLWAFAPTVAVPQDIRWGRTYEGYSGNHETVAELGVGLVQGLQGGKDGGAIDVLACAKHYVGDGAAQWGSTENADWVGWWDGWGDTWKIDQGDARISEERLRRVHLRPYQSVIEAGVGSVMASYSSWNGEKLHGHGYLLTDVLKKEFGFDGFVVSDWMGINQLTPDYEDCVVLAINAGLDMVMVPDDYPRFISAMTDAVSDGRISIGRVDDAVRRILETKSKIRQLWSEDSRPPLSEVGSVSHRELAAEAVRRSAVLLKNNGVLPIPGDEQTRVAVAGEAADDIGLQCGGWTVGWQGGTGPVTAGSTLLDGMRRVLSDGVEFSPDAQFSEEVNTAVVVVAERPYAEGPGDAAVPTVRPEDIVMFHKARSQADRVVLVVYSGRPLVIPELIERSDAVVAAWLPGSEAAVLAELLEGRWNFEGRLPHPWPHSEADLAPSPVDGLD